MCILQHQRKTFVQESELIEKGLNDAILAREGEIEKIRRAIEYVYRL